MPSLQLKHDNATQEFDLSRVDGRQLDTDDGLEAAVLISLFCDARADEEDEIPGGGDDRKGWWGDAFPFGEEGERTGSRLWLLTRAGTSPPVLEKFRFYALDALQWMIDDGVASAIEIDVEAQGIDRIAFELRVYRPTDLSSPWQQTWELRL